MSGLDIPGIGSGLDIKVMVKAIADSEMAPKEQAIKRQESRAEKELSALGRLFGAGGEFLRSSQSLQQYSLLVEGDADVLLSKFENFVDTCNQFLKEASAAERGMSRTVCRVAPLFAAFPGNSIVY